MSDRNDEVKRETAQAAKTEEARAEAGAAGVTDEEREAKRQAAAEARAARAAAKQVEAAGGESAGRPVRAPRQAAAAGEGEAAPAAPKEPSPLQPKLDAAAALVRELVNDDAVVEAYVNELGLHVPTIVAKPEYLRRTAELFKEHPLLGCRYLRNVSGVDYETYLETVYHLVNMETGDRYTIKARTDRSHAILDSVTPVWETANWNEREIYDLLGIRFEGHPDLRRIMMPDDWVGHPLRKDYEPLDPEV
ncbi:NADH-quinone oxidoreductase subunit C [Paenibacillus xylaniclasticus]|uniref:NADH-quinone oxidoreductase subunit C n=1 Tax=Paenibacillus xylaniclasticus TaxID=588083 RepID=UPI0013E0B84C|nr:MULTISPECIES: NADH-quinone oxidoreductase subunit C [Paenibacillus]GFN32700.1 hypothetical protein PCURB6_29600 [Paenibacillus curdlanolyticus]